MESGDKYPSGAISIPVLEMDMRADANPAFMPERAVLAWSGGKDSALALHEIRKAGSPEVHALLTTVSNDYDRISMHGVRRVLLERQVESLGFPLDIVPVPRFGSNEEYDRMMRHALAGYLRKGISSVVFGDIFLEDVRKHREENLSRIGMQGVFPLWKKDTGKLAREFIDRGFKAVVTCIDGEALDGSLAGREFDEGFLAELPARVDPCGENGEFHTFVYDGPMFRHRILYEKGETVLRDRRFHFCDLIPAGPG